MPPSDSQTFLRELGKKAERRHGLPARVGSDDIPVVSRIRVATGMSPLLNLVGLIDIITTSPSRYPDLRLPRHCGIRRRADFVIALPSAAARSLPRSHSADRPNGRTNPPFNIKEWWDGKLEGDARSKYGTLPKGNANFAWVQHIFRNLSRHSAAPTGLAPNGSMVLLLTNGSLSSNPSGEGDIRRALIEADLVECMVAIDPIKVTIAQKACLVPH